MNPPPSSATATPDTQTPTLISQSQPPNQSTQEGIVLNEQSDSRNRERIALGVLIASIAAVFFISFVVVRSAGHDKKQASQRVMDSTLPLYGTWVGTILAFYFSRNAFEAASSATARNAAVFQQMNSSLSSAEAPSDNTLAKISLKSLVNGLVFRQDDINKPLQDVVAELASRDRYRTMWLRRLTPTKKHINMLTWSTGSMHQLF